VTGRSPRAAGIFLTHTFSERIQRHFLRLVAESAPFVEWHLVLNEGLLPHPQTPIPYVNPAAVMPARYRAMAASQRRLHEGYLDVLMVPLIVALDTPFVWVMEYDVDYSGSWGEFFGQFANATTDVLATMLTHRVDFAHWSWWPSFAAPEWVDPADHIRGFFPLFRISRDFAHRYAVMMSDPSWTGHYEITIPTAALTAGASLEDLGRPTGLLTPEGRAMNYSGDGYDGDGTFVFRPVRQQYFHEAPATFEETNRLYHPVKPGVPLWELQ
jgi:hypothetical protein